MKPKMTKAEAKKHVIDVVTNLHSVQRRTMVDDLEKLGVMRYIAEDIISELVYDDKLLRSSGSDLRPKNMSKTPHLEINPMSGFHAIYINGEYQGQRESEEEAREVMKQLCKK